MCQSSGARLVNRMAPPLLHTGGLVKCHGCRKSKEITDNGPLSRVVGRSVRISYYNTNYLNGFVLERLSEEENRLNCTGADR